MSELLRVSKDVISAANLFEGVGAPLPPPSLPLERANKVRTPPAFQAGLSSEGAMCVCPRDSVCVRVRVLSEVYIVL